MKRGIVLLGFCIDVVKEMKEEAVKRGLNVEIVANKEQVWKAIKDSGAKYIVGACCQHEAAYIEPILEKNGLIYRTICSIGAECEHSCFKCSGVHPKTNWGGYILALDWLERMTK